MSDSSTSSRPGLRALGFDEFFEGQLRDPTGEGAVPARIAAEHRSGYEVWSEEGEGFAELAGRLRKELADEEKPGVGDWVLLRSPPGRDRTTVIDRVLERRTVFMRGAAGRTSRGQVVAANVDLVFAVCGLDEDYNVRRIERYLARIWASGALPEVILNKADVCDDVAVRVAEAQASCIGVPVHVTTALEAEGLDDIRSRIGPGMTAALVGSSGAGKSTLINALVGEERMATGAVRERDGRGQHVTTHRQLVRLPGGGLLVDTPGMRELALTDDDGLDAVFADIEELARGCRYGNCRHDTEPGCAVKAAVAAGELDAERLEHHAKLEKEAAAYELRHDEHARRQSEKVWGQLYREGDLVRRKKGG